jgi:hypothetical protein
MPDALGTGDGQFPMDVQVPILSAQTTKEGRTVIVVQGEHRGFTVGVEISVRGQMKPGIVGDDIDKTAFYGSGVIVRSMGQRTKHLADVFSEMYILPVAVAEPLEHLDLTSIALDGDPMLIETEHLNFKVFHDDEDKLGLYFAMFLHIDIPAGHVRFDEKDGSERSSRSKRLHEVAASTVFG